jgi:hypothetical protein
MVCRAPNESRWLPSSKYHGQKRHTLGKSSSIWTLIEPPTATQSGQLAQSRYTTHWAIRAVPMVAARSNRGTPLSREELKIRMRQSYMHHLTVCLSTKPDLNSHFY